MNAMMAGMAPVMAMLMMGRHARHGSDRTRLLGVMSLGVAVGFAVAYPVNVWMVSRKMKHGLMTERRPEKAQPAANRACRRKAIMGRRTAQVAYGTPTNTQPGEHGAQAGHEGEVPRKSPTPL